MPQKVLVRKFQELYPTSPEEVHKIWNTVHLLSLLTAIFSGLVTAYCFGTCLQEFNFDCFLFARLYVVTREGYKNYTLTSDIFTWDVGISKTPTGEVDYQFAKWGEQETCNFVQFLHICSMLSAIIWFIFLILPERSSKISDKQIFEKPYRVMLPLLVWSSFATVIIIGGNSTLFSGLDQFCFVLKSNKTHSAKSFCLYMQKKPYDIFFGKRGSMIYLNLAIVKAAALIGCFSWISILSWTLLRMYLMIDYKVYLVKVWRYIPDVNKKERGVIGGYSSKE